MLMGFRKAFGGDPKNLPTLVFFGRSYAKWVVAHFVWQAVGKVLKTRHLRTLFIQVNERETLPSLERLCNSAFRGVIKLYRARRGKGEKALDVSTFFQRKGLDRAFERFWAGASGSYRGQFAGALKRFKEAMREIAEER